MTVTLHSYWRSTASYRVRIALALKGIDYSIVAHDLRIGAQRAPVYLHINPQGLVPAVEADGFALSQSLAILEWLEELYPEPSLLPQVPEDRAIVRSMAGLICCDIHPLNNLRVLNFLRREIGLAEPDVQAWISHWIQNGFGPLEILVRHHGGEFAFGNAPSIADCCIIPQVYAAQRFSVDLSEFPAVCQLFHRCSDIAAFALAHPQAQPDADVDG